jgi:hypothetical protein
MPSGVKKYQEQNAAHQREQYHRSKAEGKCPHCGTRNPYPGMVSCLECRARHRRYARLHRMRQREMRKQGITEVRCACRKRAMVLCIQCQTPLCDTCYDLGEGCCRECSDAAHEAD